jgi:hypothetical protein
VTRELYLSSVRVKGPGEAAERELEWFDDDLLSGLSADGRSFLFTAWTLPEDGSAAYLRRVDGAPAVRIADGAAVALSPDASRVLVRRGGALRLAPTGVGAERVLPDDALDGHCGARFFPDGERILRCGTLGGRRFRWIQDLTGGAPRLLPTVLPAPRDFAPISPDGGWIAGADPAGEEKLLAAADGSGATRPLPGVSARDGVVGWSKDGGEIFVWRAVERGGREIERLEIASGVTRPFLTLGPEDRTGDVRAGSVFVAPGGDAYAYRVMRVLSDLYLLGDE